MDSYLPRLKASLTEHMARNTTSCLPSPSGTKISVAIIGIILQLRIMYKMVKDGRWDNPILRRKAEPRKY
ncbi:predicted protein [Sclerotinia sclerotiorum 1980 UF-70]|uniref:Uncharacterized protein n=1 Tax=Sclerotinia sclerotiorum (strain ATCC 18683 / 1980 / Ss-1) TaxID=665079 RepID=A7EE38_SCLS1|nr:predicted protein [Sclerotinia sclerotiorum 1980 UF-70]EDO01104.1 predicted protein [Sclerotinia sclerotiorum 1980 UF-70]